MLVNPFETLITTMDSAGSWSSKSQTTRRIAKIPIVSRDPRAWKRQVVRVDALGCIELYRIAYQRLSGRKSKSRNRGNPWLVPEVSVERQVWNNCGNRRRSHSPHNSASRSSLGRHLGYVYRRGSSAHNLECDAEQCPSPRNRAAALDHCSEANTPRGNIHVIL